ncbi:hypothetical protein CH262_12195 [Rhodococcus sp. 05-2255-1e]|nr:hypothetical protein ACG96_21995 [Rhodococcus fascians]OZC43543.1 hypothetical protein CHX23_00855 [Rhodococcus fascians]OZE25616.1 hypothetical protein CH262_12195 [Rhodococcus sp. 05-2255-1e]
MHARFTVCGGTYRSILGVAPAGCTRVGVTVASLAAQAVAVGSPRGAPVWWGCALTSVRA